jgi:hypothetical protein
MSHTFTEEYRRSDEYKTLSACVLAVAPTLPQILVEQAIFMHKKDPQLYKKWRNIEKEYEKTVEKKEAHSQGMYNIRSGMTRKEVVEEENALLNAQWKTRAELTPLKDYDENEVYENLKARAEPLSKKEDAGEKLTPKEKLVVQAFEKLSYHRERQAAVKNCFPSKDSTHASDEHDPPPSPRSE